MVFPTGSLVRVTSSSSFRGLKGTINTVNTIAADPDELFCFYLVVLEGTQLKAPLWFEHHEVELVPSIFDTASNFM